MISRRRMLASMAAAASGTLLDTPIVSGDADASNGKSRLGICVYCLEIRHRAARSRDARAPSADPLRFLEYCQSLGAGGVQIPLGVRDEPYATRLRRQAESWGMFIEGIASLPRDGADAERFEAELRTASRAGVSVIRVVIIPGRRYERFRSMGEFQQFVQRGIRSLELAEPIAARHRVRLAVENHKDQRIEQRLELFRRISSRYVGACVDTGNSFALLEDPIAAVQAYAPWAISVHLKDQAIQEYDDGFLLADVPFGEGFLDLPQMVAILREANPAIHFNLELITRDPLRVPCLTEPYWTTFGDVPGSDLARTLRTVRACAHPGSLPQVGQLPLEQQVARERENVQKCLAYARQRLGL